MPKPGSLVLQGLKLGLSALPILGNVERNGMPKASIHAKRAFGPFVIGSGAFGLRERNFQICRNPQSDSEVHLSRGGSGLFNRRWARRNARGGRRRGLRGRRRWRGCGSLRSWPYAGLFGLKLGEGL